MKRQKERMLYLSWARYGRLAYALARRIKKRDGRFDIVVGIARGGVPLAMVVADVLDVKIDIINVKSYTGIGSGKEARGKPRILTTLTGRIAGSDVLLVDDLIEHGDTMKSVIKYLRKDRPRSITTAVMFRKPWSGFEPDFFLATVDRWIVFPWDKHETARRMKK